MKKQLFDVVLMDFFGTVADGDRHEVETLCDSIVRKYQLPITVAEFAERWGREFFAVLDQSNRDRFRSLFDCECVSLTQTLQAFQVELDPRPYIEALREYWRRPPLHVEAKGVLASLSVPVCCVSNVDEDDLKSAIAAHGLKFDGVVSSQQARSYKPDAQIFEHALMLMDISADRCVHVGDSLHSDVSGAQKLGIATVWVKRDGRISDIGDCRPEYTIRSLEGLYNLFE